MGTPALHLSDTIGQLVLSFDVPMRIVMAMSPLKRVGQILGGRGCRPQSLMVSENYIVWTASCVQTTHFKTFARWQHDAR